MSAGAVWLEADAPERLLEALAARAYRVVGPRVANDTLVLDDLEPGDELPRGWLDEASPGRYRLVEPDRPRERSRRFGYRVGAHSWKAFLHPGDVRLFRVSSDRSGLEFVAEDAPARDLALLGARPCDVAAIRAQDRVLLEGPYVDEVYASRRTTAFLVAVECTSSNSGCFCASMGTGPGLDRDVDIVLTELLDDTRHGFVARAGSERGDELLRALPGRPASGSERQEAQSAVARASAAMPRSLDVAAARTALREGAGLPLWGDIAERCLACANCTLVCPTCFCTTVVDATDLSGRSAERRRRWDSCFGLDFSYLHGGSVRQSAAARYRHWMTHKLSSWFEQFGEAGCVGCGRCIAWCPVGIDITQEAAVAIQQAREAETARKSAPRRGPARRGGAR